MAMTRIATVTSSGIAVVYEEGVVRVGSESSTLESVIEYDRIGALTWVNEDTRVWAYEHANVPLREGTTGQAIAVGSFAPAVVVPATNKDFVSGATATVSTTARAVADGAITEPRRHSMPLWAKVAWGLSMIANGVLLALVAYLITEAVDGFEWSRILELGYLKAQLFTGIGVAGLSAFMAFLVPQIPNMVMASLVVSAVVLSFPAYGMAHRASKASRNKYIRAAIVAVLLPLFAILLMPMLFTYSGLSIALGVFLAGGQ